MTDFGLGDLMILPSAADAAVLDVDEDADDDEASALAAAGRDLSDLGFAGLASRLVFALEAAGEAVVTGLAVPPDFFEDFPAAGVGDSPALTVGFADGLAGAALLLRGLLVLAALLALADFASAFALTGVALSPVTAGFWPDAAGFLLDAAGFAGAVGAADFLLTLTGFDLSSAVTGFEPVLALLATDFGAGGALGLAPGLLPAAALLDVVVCVDPLSELALAAFLEPELEAETAGDLTGLVAALADFDFFSFTVDA